MGKMSEIAREAEENNLDWQKYEFEVYLHQQEEKEVNETYQLTETERKALNEYMEGSHAFYSVNSTIHNSSNVLELSSRKRRRNEMLKTMQEDQQTKKALD